MKIKRNHIFGILAIAVLGILGGIIYINEDYRKTIQHYLMDPDPVIRETVPQIGK